MKSILQEILERVPEALGASVVGLDGIAVEKLAAQSSFSVDLASAEWAGLAKRAAASLRSQGAVGGPEEISVSSASGLVIVRALGGDYFLCLVVGPACIPGRARFEAWRAGLQLQQALS